jgi:hypothetical protein
MVTHKALSGTDSCAGVPCVLCAADLLAKTAAGFVRRRAVVE